MAGKQISSGMSDVKALLDREEDQLRAMVRIIVGAEIVVRTPLLLPSSASHPGNSRSD